MAAERVRELRRLCAGFAGQRVVLSAVGGGDTAVEVSVRRGRGLGMRVARVASGAGSAGAQMVEDDAAACGRGRWGMCGGWCVWAAAAGRSGCR